MSVARAGLGVAMIAVCIGADAQGIHKCVGKDGKTSYSNDPCPGSKEIRASERPPAAAQGADAGKGSSARPAAAGAAVFPEMQAGKWNLRFTRAGRVRDGETCGDPIDGMRREVQEYATNSKWGCTLTTNGSGSRSVNVVYDCPSDRSPDGRPVQKGRWEISLVSASPQAFRIEMKSTVNGDQVMEGTRIGECK